jgi:uncharacterized surface protein with fasciclin (FAS1) repeats
MIRLNFWLAAAAATTFLVGCGDDHVATPAATTIVATAQATPTLSTLVAVAKFASNNDDIVNLLSNPGTLTVFAPSNAAFDALAVELTGSATAKAADLLTTANKPLLRDVLQYHVLTTKVTAANIPFGQPITAAAGGTFKIDRGTPPVITDGRNRKINITSTDIEATNGVIHLVDKVLLPAIKPTATSIVATAQATPTLSTLVAVAKFASENDDIVNLLSNPGTLTVFAPSNAAFDALAVELTGSATAKAADLLTTALKPTLRDVLRYHVLTSKVTAANIPFGKAITPAVGGIFKIDAGTPPIITDGRNRKINITATDIDATNGVIHLVDKVLLPANKTIVATAIGSSPEFTSLVAALQFASNNDDLVNLLNGTAKYTVFAPTNAAFDALAVALTGSSTAKGPDLLVAANKALVRSVLQYHVLAGTVLKADVPTNTAIATALGQNITISPEFVITDAKGGKSNITATDVLTSNGVIHVINKVLVPN